jgi:predicted phosphohydrolase
MLQHFRKIRLQYISDIHIEYQVSYPKIPIVCENIALLGDIGDPFKPNYKEFIKYFSSNCENVFLLAGNHEYWQEKYNMIHVDNEIENISSEFRNVHFLNNKRYNIGNYTILGTTLWSERITANKSGDKYHTSESNNINNLHYHSRNWLTENIKSSLNPIIIMSHHLPSYELITDEFRTDKYIKQHNKFASHLDYLIKNPVKFWLCGHSHTTLEKYINGVLCGINAYGYSKKANKKTDDDIIRFIDISN